MRVEWVRAMLTSRAGVAAILRPKGSHKHGAYYVQRGDDQAGPLFVSDKWWPAALAVVNEGRVDEPLTDESTVPLDPLLVAAVKTLHPTARWGRSARVYDGVSQRGIRARSRLALAYVGGKCVATVGAYLESAREEEADHG